MCGWRADTSLAVTSALALNAPQKGCHCFDQRLIAMSERVKKLESAGVIEGYGARVNLREIGLGLQAILRVRTTHQYIKHYLALFNDIPEVIEADRITGEDCFIVRCVFSQPADLEAVVDALAVHGSVTTSLVLSNAVRKQVPVRPG